MEFSELYNWRAEEADIDVRPSPKDKNGNSRDLKYLKWAVAWREAMKMMPGLSVKVEVSENGNPLVRVGSGGMVRITVSYGQAAWTENFPVMDNLNRSIPYDQIDARDVSDAIQRGTVKALARLGLGLYLFEGEDETPQTKGKERESASGPKPSTLRQRNFLKYKMSEKGYGDEDAIDLFGWKIDESITSDAIQDALKIIENSEPKKEYTEEDLPF